MPMYHWQIMNDVVARNLELAFRQLAEAIWRNGSNKSLPVGKFNLAIAPQINESDGGGPASTRILDRWPKT